MTAKKYSHCNGGKVYSDWIEYSVTPLKLPDGKFSTDIWTLTNKNSRGVCVYPVTSRETCKVIKCNKYEKRAPSILTSNKKIAFDIGRANLKKKHKSYDERKREMESLNRQRQDSTARQPGYFERFGACGSISCEEQTVNDFLIDQYFK